MIGFFLYYLPYSEVCVFLTCSLSLHCFYITKAAEGARIAGASRIIGIARNPDRFEEGICFVWLDRKPF